MSWRPGDRFGFLGAECTLVDSVDPEPWKAFTMDYVGVRVWGVRRNGDSVSFLVTDEFLGDSLAVERMPND